MTHHPKTVDPRSTQSRNLCILWINQTSKGDARVPPSHQLTRTKWLEPKGACCEHVEKVDDILENFFLNHVTCSTKCKSIFATCVSWSCVIVTRHTVYCVCDHENFMSFQIVLFLNNVLGILRDLLVLLVAVFWKKTQPSICSCLETQEHVSSMSLMANVFCLRRFFVRETRIYDHWITPERDKRVRPQGGVSAYAKKT